MTVLGTTLPLKILPNGTHMFSPRRLGVSGSPGTPFKAVIRSTIRWCMTPEDKDSTRFPGYSFVMAVWSFLWFLSMAARTAGLLPKGSLMVVSRLWRSIRGSCMSTI